MKPTILIQLDADAQPSVFDGVVAVDAGVQHLFRHGGVTPGAVRDLVYGALFTRGPADLKHTAIFVGGSNVLVGEAVLKAVTETFFGPFRVSVLLDANGCNTTAAAAVLAAVEGTAQASGEIGRTRVAVLGATGPVGQRVARLLARLRAGVAIGSRRLDKAQATAAILREVTGREVTPFATAEADDLARGLADAEVVIASGASGVQLLSEEARRGLPKLHTLIDLNAVPPVGIQGVEPTDRGTPRGVGVHAWGALGVGATKMKIHKTAIQELFTANDKVLDAEEVLALAQGRA
jgi:hypothetical protein